MGFGLPHLQTIMSADTDLAVLGIKQSPVGRLGRSTRFNPRTTVMKNLLSALGAAFVATSAITMISAPASALTVKDCSAKYSAAKAANSLAGKTWDDFRKTECTSDTASSESGKTTSAKAEAQPAPVKAAAQYPVSASPSSAPSKSVATSDAVTKGVVFPSVIASAYAQQSAGKARMHTCLDQYKTNKASNGNGGLEWIQKGGGYYSECNKHLKS